jgi:Tol biopolymer transport system component
VSISADGGVVGIGNRVLDTSAAPGSLAAHSRVVATEGEFGPSTMLGGLNVSPDGRTVYFSTFKTASDKPVWGSFQLRAFDLATGQTRLVRGFPGADLRVTFDPTGRYLLAGSMLRTGPATKLARLDIATGQLTQLNTSWAVNPEIAW